MYRVSDLLQPDFTRSWHEAVAVVQEVASQVVPGGTVPDPEDLLLDQDGVLQLGFGSDSPQNPVTALGTLLQSLLNGIDAPIGLRNLAADNATATPNLSSVESFQRALAFYERPVRQTDLEAIASRLKGSRHEADAAAEFERLRARINRTETPEEEEEEPAEVVAPVVRTDNPRRLIITAAVVVFAAVCAIVVYARPGFLSAPGRLSDRAEQKLADTISSGLDRMSADSAAGAAAPLAETPEAVEPATVPHPPPTTPTVGTSFQRPRPRPRAEPRVPVLALRGQLPDAALGARAAVPAFVAPPEVSRTDSVATVVPPPAGHLAEDGLIVYSAADTDVEPPRLTRQQLPRRPEPGDDTGYFDVIVSESGEVERVQLISPMRRFQERMLMAAAKAWKFTPAMRYGQPVRYRMRIAIILSDKP